MTILINKIELISRIGYYLLIDSLFKHPFITANDVKNLLKVSQPASWGLIKKLEEQKILKEIDTTKEGKVYCAEEITKIILGRI